MFLISKLNFMGLSFPSATHESNGLHIIIALILSDINPLAKTRMDLVLELKNNASKLLLAIMESRADSENAERILQNMPKDQLVSFVLCVMGNQNLTPIPPLAVSCP